MWLSGVIAGNKSSPRSHLMEVNLPEVVAEVKRAFESYETALITNDIATLDELFWTNEKTVRYGSGENLYGIDEIRAYRTARPPVGLARTLNRTVITTFGRGSATAMTEFSREGKGLGRQSQTWIRMPAGWRVVSAHVSVIAA